MGIAIVIFGSMSKPAEATSKIRPAPAFRKPTQTREGRLRQRMVADYVAALGGADRVTALQLEDIHRAADLVVLAATARAAALCGEESLGVVTRLEVQAHKAVKRLNLPVAGAGSPGGGRRGRPGRSRAGAEQGSRSLEDFMADHREGDG